MVWSTHVVHSAWPILLHFHGNFADITPMENTTGRFMGYSVSMRILFQIFSLTLNFCILIIVHSMARGNNDVLLIILFRLVDEASGRPELGQMFGWTLVSQELTGGNIRFIKLLGGDT